MDLETYFENSEYVKKTLVNARLDLQSLKNHYSRFLTFKMNGLKNQSFSIKDSCRIDNGRIVPYSKLKSFPHTRIKNVASFIPAAGSSTRYVQAIYGQDVQALHETGCILPKDEKGTLLNFEQMLALPKALYPCVEEGQSFFELKILEQKPISGIENTVCVIPPDNGPNFENVLKRSSCKRSVNFLEQGASLSTLRLDKHGIPIQEQGSASLAPAGHGSLLKLFPEIKKTFPSIESLFIRNIDNVIGCKEDAVRVSEEFLRTHRWTLENMQAIRLSLKEKDIAKANEYAQAFLNVFPLRTLSFEEEQFIKNSNDKILWTVLIQIFQTPLALCMDKSLQELFARPVNFLGQVPNLGTDRGGVPVIVETEVGPTAVCLELPHFSEEDQQSLLNPNFASHFNPVFAAVELQESIENYKHESNPYWIFAEKQWCGETVYYHESLLYEILGNSEFANLVFVEVPRLVFNPHKTLDDTKGKRLSQWV